MKQTPIYTSLSVILGFKSLNSRRNEEEEESDSYIYDSSNAVRFV